MMNRDRSLRDEAAKPVLERIQADRERASERLQPLLATIARRLFDYDFNVAALWRAHAIADKSAATRFQEVGTTPSNYIADARLEVAGNMLAKTSLPLWRVAQACGYASERTFGRAFKQRMGRTPAAYRRNPTLPPARPPLVPKISKGLRGRLPKNDSAELLKRLEGIVEGLRIRYERAAAQDPATPLPKLMNGEEFERAQAERLVWPRLEGLPLDRQHEFVRQCRPFATRALFDLLHEKSRELGRYDRQRGVDLSLLALESLEANEASLGELVHKLRPQAWAWLGNARRLAFDFLGADRACQRALAELKSTADPFAAGIVHVCRGTLRMFQRRFDEAAEILEEASPAFQKAGSRQWEVTALLHRALVSIYTTRHEEAVVLLRQAAGLIDGVTEHLAFRVLHTMATALVWAERFEEAEACLQALSPPFEQELWLWQTKWLEASVDHGLGRMDAAEEKYLAALKGLENLDETFYTALLQLDLAVFYTETRRRSSVIEICEGICVALDAMKLYDETMVSLRLLSQAIEETRVTTKVLRNLRASLRTDPLTGLPG